MGITEENNWESGDIWLQQAESKYQVLPETAEETLPKVDRICLTMEKTKDLNSLTEIDEREGAESDSLEREAYVYTAVIVLV